METKIFDIIVIGAGSGGLNIAGFMNRVGFKILLIDREDKAIGGDCLNHGCVPSKAMIHVARLVKSSREAEKFGISTTGTIDVGKVMEYVRGKQDIIREHENADYFRERGMEVVLGMASFVDIDTVEVAGKQYRGKKIIIATGSRPRRLSLPGIETATVYDNENIFSITELPKRLCVIGAGPIGIEIGQAFAHLGSKVTIVGPKLLPKEDPEIVEPLRIALEHDGIELLIGYKPVAIKNGTVVIVSEEDKNNKKDIPFDVILSSVGRELNIDKLNLKSAGIQTDEQGKIVVDPYLRTTNKRVLVCGDVAGQHMFTHAAELHASVIIRNFFSLLKKKLNTDAMAWVTYTSPEIATFGIDEDKLKKRNIQYETLSMDFSESDRAIVDENTGSKLKIFVSPKGTLFGGSMVSENAGELAQELMLAKANGMTLNSFLKKVYPYPTASRVNRTIALSFEGRKLTDRSKKLLRMLFH